MREIITLSAHPSNLDPAAQHVADMSGEFPGPVVASVYRVTGG